MLYGFIYTLYGYHLQVQVVCLFVLIILLQKEYKRDLELEVKGRGLNAMANETPDFMRARNATDIASQVSVSIPCQSFKKVVAILRTYCHSSVSYFFISDSQMHTVAFLNIYLVESVPNDQGLSVRLFCLPESLASADIQHKQQKLENQTTIGTGPCFLVASSFRTKNSLLKIFQEFFFITFRA